MKYMLYAYAFMTVIVIIVALWLSNPVDSAHTPYPDVIADVLDPSLDEYAPLWQAEVGRRFHNAIFVMCHGGDILNGEWLCLPYGGPGGGWPITKLIAIEQEKYPGRTLVILSCNPKHDALHGYPNVYYAPSSVWCAPDRAVIDGQTMMIGERLTLDGRSSNDPEDCGNIFEFLSAK